MNSSHPGKPNSSIGPAASFESRTKTAAVALAISTQCPAAPLRVLFRQVRAVFCKMMPLYGWLLADLNEDLINPVQFVAC